MFNIALYEPEIPPNTGNIIRLCANAGLTLHLIHPLAFNWNDKQLQRAGLDYHEYAPIHHHESYDRFIHSFENKYRIFAFSTRGKQLYTDISYQPDDIFLFGPETKGLSKNILDLIPSNHILRIPMIPHSRSLNLANAVSIVSYEALRQHQFTHLG